MIGRNEGERRFEPLPMAQVVRHWSSRHQEQPFQRTTWS
jgi:hypothetical protein